MIRCCLFQKLLLRLLLALGSFAEHEDTWTFTFPQFINTRKHSDVEISCTFTAPVDYKDYEDIQIVWYKYNKFQYPKVYSEVSSEVLPDYRGRTSLMRNGTNSCSLRIRDVRYSARYYPGISEVINSYYIKKEGKTVQVKVSGCTEEAPCNDWGFFFPRSIDVLKGSCVEIPCRLTYPNDTHTFSLSWYQNVFTGYPKIFNSRNQTDVEKKYQGRTSLVGNSMDDCSLRINNVRELVEIYPGINEDINSYHVNNERFCRLSIIEAPPQPIINGSDHMTEKEPVNITCSVTHTCASTPPTIAWNKPDLDVTMSHEDLDRGVWRIKSIIKYIPSYRDDKTRLTCTVTFPNGKISERSVTLDIKYKPMNVTISVFQNNPSKEGDDMTLRCTSHANPPVTICKWYDVGKTKSLTGTGAEITVQNTTSEKYICSASNDIGTRNSSVFPFIEQHLTEDEKHNSIFIIGGAAGFVTLLLLLPVITFCILKRKKICKKFLNKESDENPELTYTSLKKREVEGDYDTLKSDENPELTYTSLKKREVEGDYDTLKVCKPTIASPDYGNIKM